MCRFATIAAGLVVASGALAAHLPGSLPDTRAKDVAAQAGCPPLGARERPSIHTRAIARIVSQQANGRALGTGTLVDVDGGTALVLTCAHLFRGGAESVTVTFAGARAYEARVVKIDPAADLAALAIAAPPIAPVELSAGDPQRGDPLYSCGYGSDGLLWCNRGQALGYVTTLGSHGRETLELSGWARQGDSGGPVFDRYGRLAAVLFGTNGQVVDGTFCGRIRRFLAGLSPRFGQPRGRSRPGGQQEGVSNEPIAAAPDPLATGPPAPTSPDEPCAPDTRRCPAPPRVELPKAAGPTAGPEPIERAAAPWLAAKLAALLVSFGLPGGAAGLAGGAIVWLAMRRGRRRLQGELERLRGPVGGAPGVVERHHNRYVPFEVRALDKAWAAAHARVGEKYPGAVPYLKIVEGVKDQLLSGNDEPQIS